MKSFLCILVLVFIFISCKKENGYAGADSGLKVKTYTEELNSASSGHVTETYNLNYDDHNRIVSMISASSPGDKFVYQYLSGNSFSLDIYSNNAITIHETAFLNSFSLIDSTIQYNDTHDTTTEKYYYDAAKQLVKQKQYDYYGGTRVLANESIYTYDINGNVVSESDYGSTMINSYDSVILNTSFIQPSFFPAAKQLPTSTAYSLGADSYTITHTYAFDSGSRLISDRSVASNGEVMIKSYTYY